MYPVPTCISIMPPWKKPLDCSEKLQDTLGIVEELAHSYGQWQNMECRQMKADLMDLDADGDGRIPLGKFYGRVDTGWW